MHVTDGDVIEGQRVNSGVRLHEKPRAPSRQIRGGRNDRFIILKRRLSSQALVDDIEYLY